MNANLSGSWKANLERSHLLGPKPKEVLARIRHADAELSVEMLITKADDSEDRLNFKGPTTGEEFTTHLRGVQMRSRCRWVGHELLIESWINLGHREGHFCDFWSLSDDGQTLKMEHRNDDLAGQVTFLQKAGEEAL